MDHWIITMVSGTRYYILEVYGNILIKWKFGIPLPKKEKILRTGKMPTLKYKSSKNHVSIP